MKLSRACHIIITSSSSIFKVLLDFLFNRKKHSTSSTKEYRTKVKMVSMYSPSQNNEWHRYKTKSSLAAFGIEQFNTVWTNLLVVTKHQVYYTIIIIRTRYFRVLSLDSHYHIIIQQGWPNSGSSHRLACGSGIIETQNIFAILTKKYVCNIIYNRHHIMKTNLSCTKYI